MGKRGKKLNFAAGAKFGWLTVRRREGHIGNFIAWRCRCTCGNEVLVRSDHLAAGEQKSCGVGHRYCAPPATHQAPSLIREYPSEHRSWQLMRQRCENKRHQRFPSYGGRGIKVCERWRSFAAFISDMGRKPSNEYTIERRDVNGHYEPANCCWVPRAEQYRNMTRTVYVTYKGRKMLLIDLVRDLGLKRSVVYERLKLGWPLDVAIAVPVRPKVPSRKREPLISLPSLSPEP